MEIVLKKYLSLDSTNTEAIRQAQSGVREGFCVVADQQTAGRGRNGRKWSSPKEAGLYFSIVLRPSFERTFFPLITLMAGVAVHNTLKQVGIDPDIKWVNDLLVDERKICGILAESAETAMGTAIILGIGINISSSNLPPELLPTSISVNDIVPTATLDLVLDLLVKDLQHFYSILKTDNGPHDIIDAWKKRSSFFAGKHVQAVLPDGIVRGITDGLEKNGALRLQKDDGETIIIHAGDIQQLRTANPSDNL